jgi:hypothetical protein
MPKHYGWPNEKPEEPDFLTPEGNDLIAAYQRGYRRGLEDAAKIVMNSELFCADEMKLKKQLADAIRAKL